MKRLLAALAAALLVAALPLAASAAAPKKITSLHREFSASLELAELDGNALPLSALASLQVSPGSQLRIYLVGKEGASLFFDQAGAPVSPGDTTPSRLSAAQLAVSSPDPVPGVIQGVELGYDRAPYLSVQFEDAPSTLEDAPFACTVGLSMAGQPLEQTVLELSGVVRVDHLELAAGETSADLRGGAVALAETELPQVRLLAGDGVTVATSLSAGQRCRATAWLEYDWAEARGSAPLVIRSREVRKIYRLETANLDPRQTTVRLDSPTLLCVYNSEEEYLGTTRDSLPCLDVYFLTAMP